MPPLMNLPGYEYPRNALVDFSPVNQAIDSNRQNALMQRRADIDQQRLGMERERLGMAKAESAEQKQLRQVQRWGMQAQVIDEMPDGQQKQQLAGQFYQSNPDLMAHIKSKGIDPAHPQVWKLLRAEAGNYDPLKQRLTEAQISNLNHRQEPDVLRVMRAAGIDLNSPEGRELARSSIKGQDPLAQAKVGVLQQLGLMPPSAPAQGGQPRLIPQSNQTNPVPGVEITPVSDPGYGDPNIVPTQAAQPPAQQGLGGVMQGLTPQQRAGVGMSILGMGDAGKIIAESGNQDKLGKGAADDNDKRELEAIESYGRVKNIRASFDPSYLQWGTQANMAALSVAAKAGKLKPVDEAKLYKFATFRRDAAENANLAIKANSGATVTPQELARNNVVLPNAGTGIFDGDDYVTFKSKMDRAEEVIALGVARSRYLRQNGFKGSLDEAAAKVPVERMRDLINQRAAGIEAELRQANPQMPKRIIDREVDLRVKKEFGI